MKRTKARSPKRFWNFDKTVIITIAIITLIRPSATSDAQIVCINN